MQSPQSEQTPPQGEGPWFLCWSAYYVKRMGLGGLLTPSHLLLAALL